MVEELERPRKDWVLLLRTAKALERPRRVWKWQLQTEMGWVPLLEQQRESSDCQKHLALAHQRVRAWEPNPVKMNLTHSFQVLTRELVHQRGTIVAVRQWLQPEKDSLMRCRQMVKRWVPQIFRKGTD